MKGHAWEDIFSPGHSVTTVFDRMAMEMLCLLPGQRWQSSWLRSLVMTQWMGLLSTATNAFVPIPRQLRSWAILTIRNSKKESFFVTPQQQLANVSIWVSC